MTPETTRAWNAANRDRMNAAQRRWYEANGEKARENTRRWRQENPEKARESKRRWMEANPERVREIRRRSHERAYAKARERKTERYAAIHAIKLERGCVDCGYRAHPDALDFDHVRGVKEGNVGTMLAQLNIAMERILAEIEKCEVVCSNCHRVRTAMRRVL